LRFTLVSAVNLDECPLCATPLQFSTAQSVVGYALADAGELTS
jgi:hypothetical protein